ncbi:acid phosphatase AphA [Vibrio zhugei]|uniref:Class B acid phosphatase n=1 Tax=Vibrio zhugei TaxID=2479546 RepID=A0ABV7C9B4_9VIBR|nr:acid phosphatase AphA [Vibrio zhugei]
MRHIALTSAALLSCALIHTAAHADPKTPGTHTGYSTVELLNDGIPNDLNMVSVADLKKELAGKPPMAVGFDIDDTTLFSSPVFYRGQQEFSPNGYSYLTNQKFWDKANCGWDKFSMPKHIAQQLIAMHQKRGDDIYFITGRTGSKCHFTTTYIQKTFHITHMHDVIFAGSSHDVYTKTPYIKKHHIKIYYGDADGDIISARNAGAEGIRVMRAANSSYKPVPKNGIYGERVLKNSQF